MHLKYVMFLISAAGFVWPSHAKQVLTSSYLGFRSKHPKLVVMADDCRKERGEGFTSALGVLMSRNLTSA